MVLNSHSSQQARQKQLIETQELIQQPAWRQTITVVATTPA